ncbi:MAG TPA: EAL domain-containing protein [Telluria sp.]|nr:EAL domain-containing protein [Telluria sp.]
MTAILISVLVAATAGVLGVSYKEALRQEMVNVRNLSIAFAAQTLSVVQAVDQAMVQAERAFRKSPQNPVIDYFEDARAAQDYIIGIHVFDNDGRPVAHAAPANARVKPGYVLAPAITPGEVPRITISDVEPVTGRGILNIARAIVDAHGKRIGTILAQVDSARFERIYTLVDLGLGGSVTLFHRDGTMLVRGPPFPSGIGRSFAQTPLFTQALPIANRGTLDVISPIDGVRRIYGYDAVSNYPLVIITGVNRDFALDAWYERLWTAVGFLVLVSLILVFLAYRVARDSARQHSLIAQLGASERRAGNSAKYLASILNAVGTPIWVLDGERKLVMANDAFRRFAGCSAEELVGVPEREVLDPATAAEREQRYESVLKRSSASEAIVEIQDGNGEPRSVIQQTSRLPSAEGETQLVSVLTDITERQKAEEHLAYLANFDTLTGLPNQNQFRRVLEEQVAIARERRGCLGTLVLSLERAHEITDLLGHEAGDTALRQIAEILNSLLPRAACVARIKSAEFAMAVHAESGNCCNTLEQFANDLLHRLSEPLTMGGRDFYLGPVIGVSVYPQDGDSAEVLYRRAESARNRGRDDGGDPVHFFSSTTHSDLDQRLTVESQLRRALERNELRIVYQPKVNIRTGQIMGFEALIRWTNALLGEISPVRFIPIAERTGLIIPIGAWVLEQTCSQVQRWATESGAPVKVAVNLSPRQFHQKDLLTLIGDSVRRHGVRPGSLELEITETALMSREQEVDVLMRDIRRLGVELSIDDFGTGYSSLAYLKRFPVQRLKIDAAFVRDLGIDSDSAAIALTIINLAHGLKLSVVAEGVETQEQLEILRNMSCDEFQGYLFSPPVSPGDVLPMLEQNRASLARIE